MICVSIGRGRHKQTLAEHKHLVEQGAQLVEYRLDYIRTKIDLQRLLRNRPCPIIMTCRRKEDQGRWEAPEEHRLIMLRQAIVDGADYVDLEWDIADKIPRYGKTKRIISYHNFRETPHDLLKIHTQLKALDADIVKIATMAHSPADNMRMLKLVRDSDVPTVGFCMGEIGVPSRILAGKFGSPFTYATFHHERTLAPGQLSYKQMTEIYDYDSINRETTVYGVIADPVGHSLSPLIHNAAFRSQDLNCIYVPFRVPREDLDTFLMDCRELDIKGLSVTIPHKEDAVRFASESEAAVEGVGAANTLIWDGGSIKGYNTDVSAALESVLDEMGLPFAEGALKGKRVLLLGAGGVARALAYGFKNCRAEVVVASRTKSRGQALAERFETEFIEWDQRHEVESDILVNGTPIGMHPNVDDTPFDAKHLRKKMVVFDTIYNPARTLLVKEAREKGCKVVTGVEMFIKQAAAQFQYFTGKEAPKEVMREALIKATGAARY